MRQQRNALEFQEQRINKHKLFRLRGYSLRIPMTVDEAGFRFTATPLPKALVVEAKIDCDSFVRVAAESRQVLRHGVNAPPPV